MTRANPIKTTFNAGEISAMLDGRVDVSKYANGCKLMQNYMATIEGPAVRRGGTRFIGEIYDSSQQSWLTRFQFNTTQAYILEWSHLKLRFYTQHGRLLETVKNITAITQANPGVFTSNAHGYINGDWVYLLGLGGMNALNFDVYVVANVTANTFTLTRTDGTVIDTSALPAYSGGGTAARVYTVITPYSYSDLTGSDGTFQLRYVQSGDVVYITGGGKQQQKLSRLGSTSWTIALLELTGGPFQDQNITKTTTVYASAASGSVTLTASTGIFNANHVGAQFYLEVADFSTVLPWESNKQMAQDSGTVLNAVRRSDGKTYKCTTAGSPGAGKAWRTGTWKPVHTEGTQADGDYNPLPGYTPDITKQGLDWQFQDPGYGYLKITGYTNSTTVTATVVGDWNLPTNVVGSGNATYRWAFGAFSADAGYPTDVTFFRERLTYLKGQNIYCSVAGDFENFQRKSFGEQLPDSAIIVSVQSDQVNDIQWISPAKKLVVGTAGSEFIVGENTTSDPFGPSNVKAEHQTSHGSRHVNAARVGDSTVFLQRSGRKLQEISYDFAQDAYQTRDLTVLAEHITLGGINDMVFQQEPYSVLWATRSDGLLLGFTFNKEQDVFAWHRHPIGGNGVVESIAVIPAPDNSRDELWMIVKRTINGNTRRYVEYMTAEYQDGDTVADCLYLDSGTTYDGSATLTISGLTYWEGATFGVLADGAAHPNVTVTGGQVTLQRSASKVQLGYNYTSILQTNRIEAGGTIGTSQGKLKRIHRCIVRFLNTLGGRAGPDDTVNDEILFRSGSDPMDAAPPIFSGDKVVEWPNGYDSDGYMTIVQEQPLPMTVVALMPELATYERV